VTPVRILGLAHEAVRADLEGLDRDAAVWVASERSTTTGFVALRLHPEDRMGEIHMIAVDPDFQRRGIVAGLIARSVEWFRSAGMSIAMVETGGNPDTRRHGPRTRLRASGSSRSRATSRASDPGEGCGA
jgi:GNAT superfamily N-acetyltransferase